MNAKRAITGTVAAAVAALTGALAGFVPGAAAWSLGILAQATAGLSGALAMASAWFYRASDEPVERFLWAIVALAGLAAMAYAAVKVATGIPWLLVIIGGAIVLVGGIVAARRAA